MENGTIGKMENGNGKCIKVNGNWNMGQDTKY